MIGISGPVTSAPAWIGAIPAAAMAYLAWSDDDGVTWTVRFYADPRVRTSPEKGHIGASRRIPAEKPLAEGTAPKGTL